jgi:hypothetical protein
VLDARDTLVEADETNNAAMKVLTVLNRPLETVLPTR